MRTLSIIGTVLMLVTTAFAADKTWDTVTGDSVITDGSGTWSVDAGNWYDAGGSYDQNWTASDINAIIGDGTAGSAGTVTLGSDISLERLYFKKAGYVLEIPSGRTLTMTKEYNGFHAEQDAVVQGDGNVAMADDVTWFVDPGKLLTINNNIIGNKNLFKSGQGTYFLRGENNTSGTRVNRLNINNGTVQFEADANLGDNTVRLGHASQSTTNTVLEYVGTANEVVDNSIKIDANGGGHKNILLANGSGSITYSSFDSSGTGNKLVLGGENSDANLLDVDVSTLSGGLTKTGNGKWFLGPNQTYTGPTAVEEGTLAFKALGTSNPWRYASDSTLVVSDTATFDLNDNNTGFGGLSGEGTVLNSSATLRNLYVGDGGGETEFPGTIAEDVQLHKTGAGTLVLLGENDFHSAYIREGGTLAIMNGSALSGHTVIGFGNDDGKLKLQGDADVEMSTGYSVGNYYGSGSSQTGGAIFESAISGSGRAVVSAGNTARPNPAVTRTITLTGDNANNNEVSGKLQDQNVSAAIEVVKNGSGKWILSNANNTYTGVTTVEAGRLDISGTIDSAMTVNDDATLGGEGSSSANVTIGDGSGAGILAVDGSTAEEFTTSATLDTDYDVSVLVEAVPATFGATFDVIGYGTLATTFDASDFSVDAGGIPASGRGAIFADGTGVITLDLNYQSKTWAPGGVNPTYWDNGTSANWSLAGGDNLFYDIDKVTFGDIGVGTVDIQGTVQVTDATFSHTAGTYGLNGGEIELDGELQITGDGDLTIDSVISGAGSINKLDGSDGKLTLNGANKYTGGTVLSDGTTVVGHGDAFGTGGVTLEGYDWVQASSTISLVPDVNVTNSLTIPNTAYGYSIEMESGTSGTAEWSGDITSLETYSANNYVILFDPNETSPYNGDKVLVVSGDLSIDRFTTRQGALNLTGSNTINVIETDWASLVRVGNDDALGGASIDLAGVNSALELVAGIVTSGDETLNVTDVGGNKNLYTYNADWGTAESATFSGDITINETDANNFDIFAATIDTTILAGAIGGSGAAGLTATGQGIKKLTGVNDYSGPTTVSAGTLLINGDNSGATGDVTVNSGATLGGSGTIGGAVSVAGGGKLAPGNSAGLLTMNGSVAFTDSTSVFAVEVDSATEWDRISVDGDLTLNGATLVLADIPSGLSSLTIASVVGTLSGHFDGLVPTGGNSYSPLSGNNSGYYIHYVQGTGGDQSHITISDSTDTPTPTSSGVDVRAFQTSEGVVVEFVAYDVEADGTIMLVLLDGEGNVVWQGTVDVTAGPVSFARFLVPGLELGQSYHFMVRDEVGKWWDAPGVTVQPFETDMVSASLAGIELTFDSLPDHEYEIQWVPSLGNAWQPVTNITAPSAQTTVVVPHPDPEGASGFFRIQLK